MRSSSRHGLSEVSEKRDDVRHAADGACGRWRIHREPAFLKIKQ